MSNQTSHPTKFCPIDRAYVIDQGIGTDLCLDATWVLECEGLWFKPVRLDTVHNYYTCYWFGNQALCGGDHYHSGATHGIVLHGSMEFIHEQGTITVTAPQYCYVPGGYIHRANVILDDGWFLFYGTIEGNIAYLNEPTHSSWDVFNYVQLAKEHYLQHKLDQDLLSHIII